MTSQCPGFAKRNLRRSFVTEFLFSSFRLRFGFVFIFLSVLFLTASPTSGAPVFVTGTENAPVPIGDHLEVFIDREKSETLQTLGDRTFRPIVNLEENRWKDVIFWARFRVTNESADTDTFYLNSYYTYMDHFTFFQTEGGQWTEKTFGDHHTYANEFPYLSGVVLRLEIPPGESRAYYFRINSSGWIHTPKLSLMNINNLLMYCAVKFTSYGFFFGSMALMLVINLGVFLLLKDSAYLYYLLGLVSLGFLQLALIGYGTVLVWGDWPAFGDISIAFFSALTMFLGLLFAKKFLQLNKTFPWMDRAFSILIPAIGIFTIPCLLIFPASALEDFFQIASLCVYFPIEMTAGFVAYRNKWRPARFYLLARGFLLIGLALFIFHIQGFFSPQNFLLRMNLENSMRLGSLLEQGLLSVALIDRFRVLRQERRALEESLKRAQIDFGRNFQEQRTRIARDLHDHVGTGLTGILLALRGQTEKIEGGKELLSEVQGVLDRFRDYVHNLHSPQDVLLSQQIQEHVDRIRTTGLFVIEANIDPCARNLDPAMAGEILNIFFEWTTNLIRHSRCKSIRIRFSENSRNFRLTIIDDGSGFSWSPGPSAGSLGLRSIQDRARFLYGRVRAFSKKGRGTIFILIAPRHRLS